jgi:hypothetical protein
VRHLFLFIMLGIFALRALGLLKRGAGARSARPTSAATPITRAAPPVLVASQETAPYDPLTPQATRDPLGGWDRGVLRLAVTVGWVLGYALLWSCLFGLPALQQIPMSARIAAGAIGSVVIVALARAILSAAQSVEPSGQDPIR